jgi:serine/threonine-protein phosphatase 2B catalytic subunit
MSADLRLLIPDSLFTNIVVINEQVQAPPMYTPTDEQFYSSTDPTKPDVAFLKNHFYREGRITEEQALYIIDKGTELLKREPNLLEVDAPITGASRFISQFFLP